MEITHLVVGQMAVNCYLITDTDTKKTIVIDPGDDADLIIDTILEKKLRPVQIILTHGHFDHCLAATELAMGFGIPVCLHQLDLSIYIRSKKTADHFLSTTSLPPINISSFLTDGQIIKFGNSEIKVIHTPGHTPGSVSFYSPGELFTGDTLFSDSLGTADHQYSDPNKLKNSIKVLSQLPPTTQLHPGHGQETSLGKIIL